MSDSKGAIANLDGLLITACPEPCEHDFAAWRNFDDGSGGELFCTRCGLGAMAHTLSLEF